MGTSEDLAIRSSEIRWPTGFSPNDADIFAHNEIFIQAPASRAWRHLVEATKWPLWYPNSQNVRIANDRDGLLRQDTAFEFDTFGAHVDAKIAEFVAESRLAWFGNAPGLAAYHPWLLIPMPGGCQVITEEVAKGPLALEIVKRDPDGMHKGHDLWLTRLKSLSEK